jgi:uncharacterized LabA/DUF88 family protein
VNHFDSNNNISLQFGHRGKVAIFIDGNNLFHAARFHNIDIDYNKLLRVLLGDGRLFRAFFYTGVDAGAERQQGFLLWMRRNGFRVVQKELKTFYDGTRKANLDVEIAVDMLSLAGRYDTAVLVSGDEDFVYAVNAVAYKGCRVEIVGFRSNTAPKLIDVADCFIDLGEIADRVRKEFPHGMRYEDRDIHVSHQPPPPAPPDFVQRVVPQSDFAEPIAPLPCAAPELSAPDVHAFHPPIGSIIQASAIDGPEQFGPGSDFVRVTDDQ